MKTIVSRLEGLASAWPLHTTVQHRETGVSGVIELCPQGDPIAADHVGGIRIAHLYLNGNPDLALVWVQWQGADDGWMRTRFLVKPSTPKVLRYGGRR